MRFPIRTKREWRGCLSCGMPIHAQHDRCEPCRRKPGVTPEARVAVLAKAAMGPLRNTVAPQVTVVTNKRRRPG